MRRMWKRHRKSQLELPVMIQLPRLGKGMYLRIEQDGSARVAFWERPEDADAALAEAGIS